jgi:DNA repair protein RecN (Recombination protein N)
MLRYLAIKNFALIAEVELEFDAGMTVFTGETGAGKSILVEALGLALGDRADSSLVRTGSDQASINAVFASPANDGFQAWLAEQGVDLNGDEIIVKRQFSTDGRSRAFINGGTVPLQTLRTVGERLADIHGQNEHHALLRREVQRDLLDAYANHPDHVSRVETAHRRVREAEKALKEIEALTASERETELLRYQAGELRALNMTPAEILHIENEHQRLAHAGRLMEGARQTLAALNDEDACAEVVLGHAHTELQALAKLDPAINEVMTLLDQALIPLRETGLWLRRYLERLDADPETVRDLDDTLGRLHDLARKHHVRMEELPQQLIQIEQRLQLLEHHTEHRAKLSRDLDEARKDYKNAAQALHDSRSKAAKRLGKAIAESLQELGMPGGRFAIEVALDHEETFTPHGSDRVEFMVSANPGQPLKPLTKVASGGELSRISLGIQVIGARHQTAPTLVFDEVDVGIGGSVAEIVGRLLRRLATRGQVLCVTHLPQVAAQAHHHMQIHKRVAKDETRVQVQPLGKDERVQEIARMLGGMTITPQTVEHARAMLKLAAA